MMPALTINQRLPRLTMPTQQLTRLCFPQRLQPVTALAKLQRLIVPVFPLSLVDNDAFLTSNGEFLTSDGEALQW